MPKLLMHLQQPRPIPSLPINQFGNSSQTVCLANPAAMPDREQLSETLDMLPNLEQLQQGRCPKNHHPVDPMGRYRHCTNHPNLQKIDLVPYRFPSGDEFCYHTRVQFDAHLGRQPDTDPADFSHSQPPPLLRFWQPPFAFALGLHSPRSSCTLGGHMHGD